MYIVGSRFSMAKMKHDTPTILVAEDDLDDQETLQWAFRKITDEHHLTIVNNGKALVEFLAELGDQELPCLIVLDYNMPEMNGKETLQVLQREDRYQNIPKVIFTTSDSKKEKVDCLLIGAKDYLIKPSEMSDIIGSAKKMLGYCDETLK